MCGLIWPYTSYPGGYFIKFSVAGFSMQTKLDLIGSKVL